MNPPSLFDRWSEWSASIGLRWVDQVGLFLVLCFILLGIWRGLWWQVIRLVGVVASVVLARSLAPRFVPSVEAAFPEFAEMSAGVAYGVVWTALFLAGLVVASVLGMLGKRALQAMQLGLVDRAGGAVAGAATGVLVHCALLVVLGQTAPAFSERTLEGSRSAFLLSALSQKAHLLVDAQAAERMFPPGSAASGEGASERH